MERPWLQQYDAAVPTSIEAPRVPLYRLLDDVAAAVPRRAALSIGGHRLSYGELRQASDRLAFALRGLGVAPGDRVALLLPPSAPLAIAHFGALKAGAVVVPLDAQASPEALTAQLLDAGAETLVLAPQLAALAAQLQAGGPVRRLVVARLADYLPAPLRLPFGLREARWLSAARVDRALELRALLASNPPPGFAPGPVAAAQPALLVYAAATAAAPRGALFSHAACVAGAQQLAGWLGLRASDVVLSALPLDTPHGLCAGLHAPALAGATAVLAPRPGVRTLLRSLRRAGPTVCAAPVADLAALAEQRGVASVRPGLRAILASGPALGGATRAALEARTGGRVVEGYGPAAAATLLVAQTLQGVERPGAAGLPLPGVDVRVLSAESGDELPAGQVGHVAVRSPSLMLSFFARPGATGEALRDGWLHTGEAGMLDDDGFLTFVAWRDEAPPPEHVAVGERRR